MKKDYHIHTDFSADSHIKLAELLPRALELGYDEIAVTEHLDLLPQEMSVYGVPSLVKYRNVIQQARKSFPELTLHYGIEVGDYQDTVDLARPLLDLMQFDLVLGSVHFTGAHQNVAVPMQKPLTENEILDYYERNLNLVETCQIDVLAHLGVYKRYYSKRPDESFCEPVIKRIFEVMIQRGIALEINYSAFRRTYQFLHPEEEQLSLYHKLGGRLVSIGSDAHTLDTFDDYYQVAYDALTRFGFEHLAIKKL